MSSSKVRELPFKVDGQDSPKDMEYKKFITRAMAVTCKPNNKL